MSDHEYLQIYVAEIYVPAPQLQINYTQIPQINQVVYVNVCGICGNPLFDNKAVELHAKWHRSLVVIA